MNAPMRGYWVHKPSPPLAGVVDYFWSLSDVPSHSKECVIPTGTIELVFDLRDDATPIYKPVVSGAYSRAFVVETSLHASLVGVHLKPGGAAGLLGVAAGELADTHVELEALWGRRAVELRDRLVGAAEPAQRFRILEQTLLSALSRSLSGSRSRSHPPGVRGEIAVALRRLEAPGVEVGDVAREVQLSHRRFIQLFTEQVGMTPKRYARVRRLQRALSLATSRQAPTWTHLALDCGYFDQAHLCRDWVELTGFSPMDFLRLRNVDAKDNHLALPEPSPSNHRAARLSNSGSNTPPL
jgi:AraC-like DNA-binding protein